MPHYIVQGRYILRTLAEGGHGKRLSDDPPEGTESVWLAVCKVDGGHTTIDWWKTKEEAEAHLRLSELFDYYVAKEFRIQDRDMDNVELPYYGRFTGTELPREEGFDVWTDCVLTTGIHDIPPCTHLDQIQFNTRSATFYYHTKNGVLLATEQL